MNFSSINDLVSINDQESNFSSFNDQRANPSSPNKQESKRKHDAIQIDSNNDEKNFQSNDDTKTLNYVDVFQFDQNNRRNIESKKNFESITSNIFRKQSKI